MTRVLAVIPARYASTRFPGKPLAMINGKSMVRRVWEQTRRTALITDIVIATDDRRIYDHAVEFGANAMMTRADHLSGTDRCAEVARRFDRVDFVVNIQGDEPFIAPEQIDQLVQILKDMPRGCGIATLVKRIENQEELFNPNVVKAVVSLLLEALYFSRHPIPFLRGEESAQWLSKNAHFKHIGLYGYRRTTLLRLPGLTPSMLEQAESLEQLRWLENGLRIKVGETSLQTLGIDTPEDLDRVIGLSL